MAGDQIEAEAFLGTSMGCRDDDSGIALCVSERDVCTNRTRIHVHGVAPHQLDPPSRVGAVAWRSYRPLAKIRWGTLEIPDGKNGFPHLISPHLIFILPAYNVNHVMRVSGPSKILARKSVSPNLFICPTYFRERPVGGEDFHDFWKPENVGWRRD